MSLINFPSIPSLPGVPALPQNPFGVSLPTFGLNLFSQATGDTAKVSLQPKWQITDATYGTPLIVPDSVVDFEWRGEQKVPNYPLEQGSFSSYNKVAMPFDARVTCTCSGNGPMSKSAFLIAIQTYLGGMQLCSIVTPDATYTPCSLIHADYRREARNGISLIVVQLWFQEIRQPVAATVQTAAPDVAAPVSVGQVAAVTPTALQSSMVATAASVLSAIQSSSNFAQLASSVPGVAATLSAIPGASRIVSQINGMASIAGNINRVVGNAVGPAVLGSIPSRMNDLAGSLSAATGGNAALVSSITSVLSAANTASDVAKLASLAIL